MKNSGIFLSYTISDTKLYHLGINGSHTSCFLNYFRNLEISVGDSPRQNDAKNPNLLYIRTNFYSF